MNKAGCELFPLQSKERVRVRWAQITRGDLVALEIPQAGITAPGNDDERLECSPSGELKSTPSEISQPFLNF
jgi:hypothetical protein